jgi:FixJ family two-component response regulator
MLVPPARTVAVIDDDRRVLTPFAILLASRGYGTRSYESALDFFPTATRVRGGPRNLDSRLGGIAGI